MTYTIKDNCEMEFIDYLNKNLNEENKNITDKGMISLHSCGDLTPSMLKIFKCDSELKFVVAFSCCYHRMSINEHGKFSNFPMSNTLKELIANEYYGFDLSVFAFRLACQETM